MNVKEIPARDVHEGQQITAVPGERLRPNRSGWPTVTDASFLEDGEGGKPTVYIETHEMPGYAWCLRPDETVRVRGDEVSPVPWRHVLRPNWQTVARWVVPALLVLLMLAMVGR